MLWNTENMLESYKNKEGVVLMYISNWIRPISTKYSPDEIKAKIVNEEWFYIYNFNNKVSTEISDSLANLIHQTRADLVFPFIDNMFAGRWRDTTCLDIACHQGWFTTQLAIRGAKSVVGFDIRDEHIRLASLIKDLGSFDNIMYQKENLYSIDETVYGQFDLTLFLGLLYHLDNPIAALKKVRALTKNICVIETQVARECPKMECLNGAELIVKQGYGIVVVDSDESHVENGLPVVLIPTLKALYQMLYAVGFDRLYLAVPPKRMYDQYPDFDRVVIFAQVFEE